MRTDALSRNLNYIMQKSKTLVNNKNFEVSSKEKRKDVDDKEKPNLYENKIFFAFQVLDFEEV